MGLRIGPVGEAGLSAGMRRERVSYPKGERKKKKEKKPIDTADWAEWIVGLLHVIIFIYENQNRPQNQNRPKWSWTTNEVYSKLFFIKIAHNNLAVGRLLCATLLSSNTLKRELTRIRVQRGNYYLVAHRIIRSWYTGRSPPRPLLPIPNVTAHPSTASVPITVYCCIMVRCCSAVLMCP